VDFKISKINTRRKFQTANTACYYGNALTEGFCPHSPARKGFRCTF